MANGIIFTKMERIIEQAHTKKTCEKASGKLGMKMELHSWKENMRMEKRRENGVIIGTMEF